MLAAAGGAQLGGRIGEGEQARAGQLVDPPVVAATGERLDCDVSDVLEIDERLGDVSCGKGDVAAEYRIGQKVLGEVLREPAAAQDGPGQRQVGDAALAECGSGFATPGEQHDAGNAGVRREFAEGGDPFGGTVEGEIRRVAQVHAADVGEGWRPGRPIAPVESDGVAGSVRATGPDPHRDAAVSEALSNPATGLAGAAGEKNGGHGGWCRCHASTKPSWDETFHG